MKLLGNVQMFQRLEVFHLSCEQRQNCKRLNYNFQGGSGGISDQVQAQTVLCLEKLACNGNT